MRRAIKLTLAGFVVIQLTFGLSAFGQSSLGQIALGQPINPAMILVDMSQSAKSNAFAGTTKLTAVQDLMVTNLERWQKSVGLGLMSFGHRRQDDCQDVEFIFDPGKANRALMSEWFASVRPGGPSPLAEAIGQAAEQLSASGGSTLIVISDAVDNCGADLCALGDRFAALDNKVDLHLVGFGLKPGNMAAIDCLIDSTNGSATSVDSSDQLLERVNELITGVGDNTVQVLTRRLEAMQQEMLIAQEQCENDKQALGRLISERDALFEQQQLLVTEAQRDRNLMVEQQQDMTTQLADCRVQQNTQALEITDLNARLITTEASLGAFRVQAAQENEILAETVGNRNAQLKTFEQQYARLTAEMTENERQVVRLKTANQDLVLQLEEFSKSYEQLEAEKAQSDQAIVQLNLELEEANDRTAAVREQLRGAEIDKIRLRGELEKAGVDIKSLEEEKQRFENLNNLLLARIKRTLENEEISPPETRLNRPAQGWSADAGNLIGRVIDDNQDVVRVEIAPGALAPSELTSWVIVGAAGKELDRGVGATFAMPTDTGIYKVEIAIDGFTTNTWIEVNDSEAVVHGVQVDLGILDLSVIYPTRDDQGSTSSEPKAKESDLVIFQGTEPLRGEKIGTEGRYALVPGLYSLSVETNGSFLTMPFEIRAGVVAEVDVLTEPGN